MSLVIYNTKTRQKEELKTIEEGKLRMYVCGITPYDFSHIGHARCYVSFDLVFRYLEYSGYDVTYVRNYTDIDDNIIKRANEKGVEAVALAAEFIQAYQEDMKALHVRPAHHEPKVSETIVEIVEMVEKIIERDMAYEIEGDVYFAVDSMADYGKLSGRILEDLQSGARVSVDERKRNPNDFALWKSAKPGEPSWPSPWGLGRPGWHIECSAMSQKFLGENFDIHGGGKDLVFPHHENEVAQSEAFNCGKTHVNYWMHNGFVNIDNEKMSKSLDNFFTIREVLKVFHPETVRFFLLSTHYRSPINYSDTNLAESRKRLDYMYESIQKACETIGKEWSSISSKAEGIYDTFTRHKRDNKDLREWFAESMDDDFNAPRSIGYLSDLFCSINNIVDNRFEEIPQEKSAEILEDALRYVKEFSTVLGLWQENPSDYLTIPQGNSISEISLGAEEIEALLVERQEARKNKNFARSDEIRDLLITNKIEIKDSAQGTTWKYACG